MKLRFAVPCLIVLAALALGGCSTTAPGAAASLSAPAGFAPMPEPVTSFGAIASGNWLYVYGGHKGERHEYSAEMVSGSFHRLNLERRGAWERLPGSSPGQGLPLVAHRGSIYRVGGMAARNAAGARQDLYSTALVQRFDPRRGRWEDGPPLPAPRSSHDAVVAGGQLYVAGGWRLTGGTNKAVWPSTAMVLDLSHPDRGWREFPQPFQRRALALVSTGSRLFCIGGMGGDNQAVLDVDVFDTATGRWMKGPDLPAGKHKGFSCSAVALNGRIYVSAFQGDLLRLSRDERSWEVTGRLHHPRMSHRLVSSGAGQIIALGGEDGEAKRPELELLIPGSAPSVTATRPSPSNFPASAP